MWDSLAFSGSLIVTALVVVSCGMLYLFLGLAQLTSTLGELFKPSLDQPPNGLQQLIEAVSHMLLSGEVLMHLNQSAFAAAAVLFSLVVLLIFVEEALLRVKEKVRQWGRLPSPQVLHYYNQNSYDTALAQAGRGLSLKKAM
ncbi:hypothetical protein conserved [Leishmania donovani]|uniref:Uncharacterized protein n=3 Tax=Leishmania donovani species complex TaxID=38574 RepID=A4IBX1_LEIIN|nr:conserved hypothetical protein [Leishmania infantum JPCM5]XP_003865016.1 hypothetical protein, conserved [Leishmania donovani]CAC9546765.1 hypothetical_protein_-_conserved [Leishmania infantum]AYU83238.1 hypothetical protein LdCL_350048900 [Leishmania donovani]TPP44693.1 hypothetical protein CGC21_7630 [Leishmania donovani]TPP47901.1 hypothetical protein CGC20_14575 [Leishmania donovani]CAJ1993249.1 hypothetical protein conserved [Leishmania donovani]|eukprot:XP_001469240.1 conserved hypothetical protein [Leishmania infantum JPCM5]